MSVSRRCSPDVAASLGTRVVVVGANEVGRAEALLAAKLDGNEDGTIAGEVEEALTTAVRKLHAANVAIACRVAIEAGFAEGDVWDAARMLPVRGRSCAASGDRSECSSICGRSTISTPFADL